MFLKNDTVRAIERQIDTIREWQKDNPRANGRETVNRRRIVSRSIGNAHGTT